MSRWQDQGDTLLASDIRKLVRDACAHLGKCALNSSPAQILAKSASDLNFDRPPLRQRPNHERRALYYVIIHFLHQARIYVPPDKLSATYFVENREAPLRDVVPVIRANQEYPAY